MYSTSFPYIGHENNNTSTVYKGIVGYGYGRIQELLTPPCSATKFIPPFYAELVCFMVHIGVISSRLIFP